MTPSASGPASGPSRARVRLSTSRDVGEGILKGRSYGIPFDRVWNTALALVREGVAGSRLLHADDIRGILEAEGGAWLGGAPDEVWIRISLDENVQTRVDVDLIATSGLWIAPIRHRWRLARLLAQLDARLNPRRR
jgi:hypothetical protein